MEPDLFERLNRIADFLRAIVSAALENENLQPVLAWVMAPGLLLFERLGVHPSSTAWLLAAFLVGWFLWVRVSRILYFIFARTMGLASPEQYFFWTHFWLPWQKPYRGLLEVRRFFRQKRFHEGPKQFWAGFWEHAANPFNAAKGSILVGRLALWQRLPLHMPVGLPDGGKHVACISYSSGGKTSWIMTWLGCLQKQAAAVIFDVDGAMVNAFGYVLRKAGHNVVKIDVDNIAKGYGIPGHWNPMNELDVAAKRHGAASVVAFSQILSSALIVEDSKTQPVFAQTARVIMTALILWCWLMEENKTLMRVRELLTRGLPEKIEDDEESAFGRLIFEMSALPARYAAGGIDDGCGGAICTAIANCSGLLADTKQGHSANANAPDNFRKTAIYQTLWLDDPNVIKIIGGGTSDVCCEELKLSNTVVFIVSTLTDVQTRLAPLVRAFVLLTLYAFQRTEPDMKLKYPCLFILDEFPNLGRMETCAQAAPGYRKYGVRLVTISQSLGLVRKTYPEEFREFLNQAECVLWMGISQTDTETLTYLSQSVLGECIRKQKIDGYHWSARMLLRCIGIKSLPPARYQKVPRLLMTSQQCAAFLDRATGQVIVTREGRAPMRLQRLLYWKELPVWRYAVHKGHGETFLRARTRLFLSSLSKGLVP